MRRRCIGLALGFGVPPVLMLILSASTARGGAPEVSAIGPGGAVSLINPQTSEQGNPQDQTGQPSPAGSAVQKNASTNTNSKVAAKLRKRLPPGKEPNPAPDEGSEYLAAEVRIVRYIHENVKPGNPLLVSKLYNEVFVQANEHLVLDKFYNAFFRIPQFLVQYRQNFGAPPSLAVISQQFDLKAPGAADAILQVMEDDPRVPRLFKRDPQTGELTHVYAGAIRADPRFAEGGPRRLGGFQGKASPGFALFGLNGELLDSAKLSDKTILLYVWFTGCPPCMKEASELIDLQHDYENLGLEVVGANADRMLALPYADDVRKRYVAAEKINFPVVYWNKDADIAYGRVSIFPTIFLINRQGIIVRQWLGYVDGADLREAVSGLVGSPSAVPASREKRKTEPHATSKGGTP